MWAGGGRGSAGNTAGAGSPRAAVAGQLEEAEAGSAPRAQARRGDVQEMEEAEAGSLLAGGSFYLPDAVRARVDASAATRTSDRRRIGTLDSAIRDMREALGDEDASNEERAQHLFDHLIPALNAGSHARRQYYTTEYGSGILGGVGCVCYCGKCHLQQDLPFASMQAFLYSRVEGDVAEVLLTSHPEHARQLLRNGARPLKWTAFGSSNSAADIDAKCPRMVDEATSAQLRADLNAAPVWLPGPFKQVAGASEWDSARHGLPLPSSMLLKKQSWTVGSLSAFMEQSCKVKGIVFPGASMWPVPVETRKLMWKTFVDTFAVRPIPSAGAYQSADQVFVNACKLYWWLHNEHSGLSQKEPSYTLVSVTEFNRLKEYKPTERAFTWVKGARDTASRVANIDVDEYWPQ